MQACDAIYGHKASAESATCSSGDGVDSVVVLKTEPTVSPSNNSTSNAEDAVSRPHPDAAAEAGPSRVESAAAVAEASTAAGAFGVELPKEEMKARLV